MAVYSVLTYRFPAWLRGIRAYVLWLQLKLKYELKFLIKQILLLYFLFIYPSPISTGDYDTDIE